MFRFEFPASILREGGNSFKFTIIPEDIQELTLLRWEIMSRGVLPISESYFGRIRDEVSFDSGDTQQREITIHLLGNSHTRFAKSVDIQVVKVETEEGGEKQTLLASDVLHFPIANNSLPPGSPEKRMLDFSGSDAKNVAGLALSDAARLTGLEGDTEYLITRYQYGDLEINDSVGTNTIKFDYGTTITDYETPSNQLVLTLATGAEITITAPNGGTYRYQIGNLDPVGYTDFIRTLEIAKVGMNGKELTVESAAATPTLDEVNPNGEKIGVDGTYGDDIFGASTDNYLELPGTVGVDVYVITRYQYGDVTLDDLYDNENIIKLDFGVTITDYHENSSRFSGVIGVYSVELTLSTGAKITIYTPGGDNFRYQIGDGEMLTYTEFKDAIGATGTNRTSAFQGNQPDGEYYVYFPYELIVGPNEFTIHDNPDRPSVETDNASGIFSAHGDVFNPVSFVIAGGQALTASDQAFIDKGFSDKVAVRDAAKIYGHIYYNEAASFDAPSERYSTPYEFVLDSEAVDSLRADENKRIALNIVAQTETEADNDAQHRFEVNIIGHDDATRLTGEHRGTVIKDEQITARGVLNFSDPDKANGDLVISSHEGDITEDTPRNFASGYGGTFRITRDDGSGNLTWFYTLNESDRTVSTLTYGRPPLTDILPAGAITISDGTEQITSEAITITIRAPQIRVDGSNNPPLISVYSDGSIPENTTAERNTFMNLAVVDVDTDSSFTFKVFEGEQTTISNRFEVRQENGGFALFYNPTLGGVLDYEDPLNSGAPEHDRGGVVPLIIEVDDGSGTDNAKRSATAYVRIHDINEAPQRLDSVPSIVPPDAQAGESYSFTLPAIETLFTDPDASDDDSIVYVARLANGAVLPTWLEFDGVRGIFSSDNVPDERKGYEIILTARDDENLSDPTQSIPITITIDGPNALPRIARIPSATIDEGGTLLLDDTYLNASDRYQGADELTYQMASGGDDHILLNGVRVTKFTQADVNADDVEVRYKHDGSEITTRQVAFRVDDGNGGTDLGFMGLTITPINDTPVVDGLGGAVDGEIAKFTQVAVRGEFTITDDDIIAGVTADDISITLYYRGSDDRLTSEDINLNPETINTLYGSFILEQKQGEPANKWFWTYTLDDRDDNTHVAALGSGMDAIENIRLRAQDKGIPSDRENLLSDTETITINITGATYDPFPVLSVADSGTIAVNEGQGVTLTTLHLIVDYEAPNPPVGDDQILYTVGGLSGNDKILVGPTQTESLTFTRQELKERKVVFKHDGRESFENPQGAYFTVFVSDGAFESEAKKITLNVVSQNDSPAIEGDTQGEINKLRKAEATGKLVFSDPDVEGDPDSDDLDIAVSISDLAIGELPFFASQPNTPRVIPTRYGNIKFERGDPAINGEWIWTYTLNEDNNAVRNLATASDPLSEAINFVVRDNFERTDEQITVTESINITISGANFNLDINDGLAVDEGAQGVLIPNGRIVTTYLDSVTVIPAIHRFYIVTRLEGDDQILVRDQPNNRFTQWDLDFGHVKYSHDGREGTTSSFDFLIEAIKFGADSHTFRTEVQTFNFNITPVNDEPVLEGEDNHKTTFVPGIYRGPGDYTPPHWVASGSFTYTDAEVTDNLGSDALQVSVQGTAIASPLVRIHPDSVRVFHTANSGSITFTRSNDDKGVGTLAWEYFRYGNDEVENDITDETIIWLTDAARHSDRKTLTITTPFEVHVVDDPVNNDKIIYEQDPLEVAKGTLELAKQIGGAQVLTQSWGGDDDGIHYGTFGNLKIAADGSYEYKLTADRDALHNAETVSTYYNNGDRIFNSGERLSDTFTVTGTATDGKTASHTLTFSIRGLTTVVGTHGDDRFPYSGSPSPLNELFQGGNGNDNIATGRGYNIAIGGHGNDLISIGIETNTVLHRFASLDNSNWWRLTDGGDTINNYKIEHDKFVFIDTDGTATNLNDFLSTAGSKGVTAVAHTNLQSQVTDLDLSFTLGANENGVPGVTAQTIVVNYRDPLVVTNTRGTANELGLKLFGGTVGADRPNAIIDLTRLPEFFGGEDHFDVIPLADIHPDLIHIV